MSPFRYFHSAPEVIRQVVMLHVRYPLSLRNVEDLLFERGYDVFKIDWEAPRADEKTLDLASYIRLPA